MHAAVPGDVNSGPQACATNASLPSHPSPTSALTSCLSEIMSDREMSVSVTEETEAKKCSNIAWVGKAECVRDIGSDPI